MWGIVYLVLMAVIVTAIVIRPYYALVGLLSMFALEQWGILYYPIVRSYGQLTNILFLSLLIFSVLRRFQSISFAATFSDIKVRFLGALLIALAAFSLLWTPADVDVFSIWRKALPYMIAAIILAPLVFRSVSEMQSAQIGLIYYAGFLLLLFAFIPQWHNRRLFIGYDEELALPLALAQLSGYVMIASIFHFRKSILTAVVSAAAIICAFIVLVKSGSRGQFIFVFLSVGLVASYAWGEGNSKRIAPVFLLMGVLSGIAYFVFQETGLLTDRWDSENLSADLSGRFLLSFELLGHAFSNPLTMLIGLGNSASFSATLLGYYPHVVPLEILGEEGLIGFGIFVTMIVLIFRSGSLLLNSPLLTAEERKVVAVNSAWWLFTFLLCFKQGSLVTSPELFLFAALNEKCLWMVKNRVTYEHYRSTEASG